MNSYFSESLLGSAMGMLGKNWVWRTSLLLLGLASMTPARAYDLYTIYRDAKQQDPILQQAAGQRLSDREILPQARAGLMPKVNITGSLTRQKQHVDSEVPGFPPRQIYNSHDYTLSGSQAIINLQTWFAVDAAQSDVKRAEAVYFAANQNLVTRVAKAYFDILEASDTLRFTQSKKRSNYRQLDQAKQRFKVGLEAVTSVYEAQAAYDASVAEEIAAKNDLDNTYEALRNLTGRTYAKVASFQGAIPLLTPKPDKPNAWVDLSVKQNFNLMAQRYAQEAARRNIKVQSSLGLPTIAANISMNDRGSNAVGFNGNFVNTRAAALELAFPVFQGGANLSKMQQSKYDYQVAQARFDEVYRQTIVDTRQTYNTVTAGISKIRADRQAVRSAQNSVESTEAQFQVGTRTMVDVLIAQQRLFEAQRNLAVDEYAYLNATLKLKELAGILSEDDLKNINNLMYARTENRKEAAALYR